MRTRRRLLVLVSERVQVQVFPAFEGLSTFGAREWMAGVEQFVMVKLILRVEARRAVRTREEMSSSLTVQSTNRFASTLAPRQG